ncbi:MAG: hypothetical protein NVSMB38_24280 [Ktedonobacteraceae bacterium]
MARLSDMFMQARRAQSGGGMGFLGKNKGEFKPRAAALVVELPTITAGSSEALLKAGADGLLFTWKSNNGGFLETLKKEIDSSKSVNENIVTGLRITSGYDKLDRESLTQIKEYGIQYIVLPLNAPARLLALEVKDLEVIITVPMRQGDMYPLFIRNLTAFDGIAAVLLDFGMTNNIADLSIEDILQYRAVREAVRFPALIAVQADLNEADAYTLLTLGVQAIIFTAKDAEATTRTQIQALHELLQRVHHEEKDDTPGLRK